MYDREDEITITFDKNVTFAKNGYSY